MKPVVRRWTAEEFDRLKKLAADGASVMRCAAALNRSGHSVTKAARTLGFELKGMRTMKVAHKRQIEEAERSLPIGARRNDGTYV